MSAAQAIRHVLVLGRVQGVGFRAFVEEEAFDRGLSGWVRNRRDGSVEAVFAGDPDLVADMVRACRQGPFGARVDALYEREGIVDELGLASAGTTFTVLPTA